MRELSKYFRNKSLLQTQSLSSQFEKVARSSISIDGKVLSDSASTRSAQSILNGSKEIKYFKVTATFRAVNYYNRLYRIVVNQVVPNENQQAFKSVNPLKC